MAASLASLEAMVRALEAKLDRSIGTFEAHIKHCDDSSGKIDRLTAKIDRIEQLPMRAVRWIGTLVVGAAITQLVTVYVTSHESAVKASQAAQAAQETRVVTAQGQATIQKQLTVISAQTNSAGP